jgi:hypothetical protein
MKLVPAATSSKATSKFRPVEFSPIWIRPIGVVPKSSVLLSAAMRTPSNQVSDSPEAPLIRTRTWTSCHTPVDTGVELVVDTGATSFL